MATLLQGLSSAPAGGDTMQPDAGGIDVIGLAVERPRVSNAGGMNASGVSPWSV